MKKDADYVFSLKGNQESLHEQVKEYRNMLDFNKPAAEACLETLFFHSGFPPDLPPNQGA